jgi:hypothetical protein
MTGKRIIFEIISHGCALATGVQPYKIKELQKQQRVFLRDIRGGSCRPTRQDDSRCSQAAPLLTGLSKKLICSEELKRQKSQPLQETFQLRYIRSCPYCLKRGAKIREKGARSLPRTFWAWTWARAWAKVAGIGRMSPV